MDLLPQQLADEREDAIIQFMNSFSKERNATIRQAAKELAKERETASTDIAHIVSEFNTVAEHRIDHIFKRFIQLIVILSICLLIIVIVNYLIAKRLSSSKI